MPQEPKVEKPWVGPASIRLAKPGPQREEEHGPEVEEIYPQVLSSESWTRLASAGFAWALTVRAFRNRWSSDTLQVNRASPYIMTETGNQETTAWLGFPSKIRGERPRTNTRAKPPFAPENPVQ